MTFSPFSSTLTVTEVCRRINENLEGEFTGISIEGEVSGFKTSAAGHCYFSLKDSDSVIQAAIFRNSRYSIREIPSDGDLVIAYGSLSFYSKNGSVTFIVTGIMKKGAGDLAKAIEIRKQYYRSLGWFDEDIKKKIPEEIESLGVVTSPTGAALRDILITTKRRAPSLNILIFPASVQGSKAAHEIASRIRQANNFMCCSLLIVGRGGGSLEDLSCFSDDEVVKAIHESKIPIISAVGHEVDWSISDYVADLRAATPTAAAEIATATIFRRRERLDRAEIENKSLIERKVREYEKRLASCMAVISEMTNRILSLSKSITTENDLRRLMQTKIARASLTLAHLTDNTSLFLEAKIRNRRNCLTNLEKDVLQSIEKKISLFSSALERTIAESEALSPYSILGRGYAFATNKSGGIIRSSCDIREGETMNIRVRDAEITATAEVINEL